jgi:imidazolonepropionase-like amidohydrolase
VNVIDVDGGIVQSNHDVLIRDGRIADVSRFIVWDADQSIEAGGAYLFPGLIDCHVHLFLDAGDNPRSSFLESGDEAKLRTARANALKAIRAGITTVRDCGAPHHLIFGFQRAVARGEILGPRIITCGSPLTRPKGHPHFFRY